MVVASAFDYDNPCLIFSIDHNLFRKLRQGMQVTELIGKLAVPVYQAADESGHFGLIQAVLDYPESVTLSSISDIIAITLCSLLAFV